MRRLVLMQIEAKVEKIEAIRHDDERAHIEEDELYYDVLSAIAEGRCEKPREAAALALKARNITFARWHA